MCEFATFFICLIHAEGSVSESQPVRRSDVVREQDDFSVDELPSRGQAQQIRSQWMTMHGNGACIVGGSERPQQVRLFDDGVGSQPSVVENQPTTRRSDVVWEQDDSVVDELPSTGQAQQIRSQWMTLQSGSSVGGIRLERPQPVSLFDEDVRSQPSVVENEPTTRRSDVVREEDETEAEVLLKRGFARHLAGFYSSPHEQVTAGMPQMIDLASLRGAGDTGVVENQPQRLEGVARANDPVGDDWSGIEHGLTRCLATQWSTRQDTTSTPGNKQPFRMDLEVDPNETAVFENEPQQRRDGVVRNSEPVREVMGQRGQIRHITRKYSAASLTDTPDTGRGPPDKIAIDLAEGPAVLENEPAQVDPSVVRSAWTDTEDGAPQPGTTRSMLQRWTSQQDNDRWDEAAALTKPAWLVEWELTPEGSGVFENVPAAARDDVIREVDYEPEMIPIRQTRRTRAMWSRLENEDDANMPLYTATPQVLISPNSTWLDSPRLDSTRHVRLCRASRASRASRDERVVRDEPCCSNMADDEQAIVFAYTSLVVFMLLHTQILFVSSNKIN